MYIMLSLLSVTRCQDSLKDDVELLNIVQLRISRCIAVWLLPPINSATFWCLELSKCRKFMCQCCLFWCLFDKHCLNSTILCGCHNPEMYHLRKVRWKLVVDGMPEMYHTGISGWPDSLCFSLDDFGVINISCNIATSDGLSALNWVKCFPWHVMAPW